VGSGDLTPLQCDFYVFFGLETDGEENTREAGGNLVNLNQTKVSWLEDVDEAKVLFRESESLSVKRVVQEPKMQ
jgi:hypothetical protein